MFSADEFQNTIFQDLRDSAKNHKVSPDSKPLLSLHTHQKLYNCNKLNFLKITKNGETEIGCYCYVKIEYTYTVFEEPFPRTSLYCNQKKVEFEKSITVEIPNP